MLTFRNCNNSSDKKISKHFSLKEFDCSCGQCKWTLIHPKLLDRLEILRKLAGHPILLTSGYRCQSYQNQLRQENHNAAVEYSQHCLGKAADIKKPVNLSIETIQALFSFTYESKHFIHVDVR